MWISAPMIMIVTGIASAIGLQFLDAPYGKFGPDQANHWGPLIPAHWGWFLQESPSILLVLLYAFVWADPAHAAATPNRVLAFLFCFHYFVRAWIFPFLLNQSKPSPLSIILMAFVFCLYNGWMQGQYLFLAPETAPDQYEKDWLYLPRVQAGIVLFVLGWCINQHADYILRHLRDRPSDKERKDGADSKGENSAQKRYRIPYGGMFKFTSAANYTGEIIEWGGFALAAGSAPALAFWLFTIFNLAPRAVSSHKWYHKHFPNYPKDRKAVIPFVL